MDEENPGPSRPKRRFTDYEMRKPLTLSELEELAYLSESDQEPFVDSGSEYELDQTSSSEEDELPDVAMLKDANLADDVENNETITVQNSNSNIPKWTDVPNQSDFLFSGVPGLRVNLTSDDPIDFFQLFLTNDFLEHIATQTNNYAEQLFVSKETKEKSRITDWKPLTVSTLKTFLGLWLHMGNIQLNRLQDYWKTDELYNLSCFRNNMSRNRFLAILRCLHFSKIPERGDPEYGDRLCRIRWLQNYFNERIDEIYYPNKELALDESMVLWRGRLVFRQYIKNKKHKFGVKLYILSEPNGLVLKARIYTGDEKDMKGELGHAANVVLSLLNNYSEKGHSLYMDNYYNSIALCKELLLKKTYATGTLRLNRKGNPPEVTSKKLKKGEAITKYCNGVAVGKWRDKREVLFISTEFSGELIKQPNKWNEEKEKPNAIINYNKHMSGIDRQDQMLAYYTSERKTIRWYKKLAIHLISMMLLNSYHLYNKYSTQKKLSYYDYRHNIIKKLLCETKEKPSEPPKVKPNQLSHLPEKYEMDDKGRQMRKRCRVCYKHKMRKNTPYFCPACPDKPGLCLGDCFRVYHAEK